MAKKGRPSTYTPELAALICFRVATNPTGLKNICDKFGDMPDQQTIVEWRHRHPDFDLNYARAKLKQAHLMAENLSNLVEEKGTYIDSEGNERVDSGFTQHQRLKIDTHKWLASKLLPKHYGDRIDDNTAKDSLIEQLIAKIDKDGKLPPKTES